jgi:uncharacterized membrane protein
MKAAVMAKLRTSVSDDQIKSKMIGCDHVGVDFGGLSVRRLTAPSKRSSSRGGGGGLEDRESEREGGRKGELGV